MALLEKYVRDKQAGAPAAALESSKDAIRVQTGHPTVWVEIKRQRSLLAPKIGELFAVAPEALTW